MRRISKLAEYPLGSQGGVCSKELVKIYFVFIVVFLVKVQDPSEWGLTEMLRHFSRFDTV